MQVYLNRARKCKDREQTQRYMSKHRENAENWEITLNFFTI